ncbi:uncharacterized protein K460DRAFT_399739 [Cucurbitaria berberidis CBS 394.84]|uniref:F-box domain-containing protein n=1 Tax=Cucurbitaria berberidis CBS 394.84 TaxID=1168544 RepID=A0A9P4GR74_9PLEO|nr:uncharacterized protein K460DRAFT_399739 [Cucurbitaria berberidis CBS 394.84]KAF1849626.1 hypothetical protein K460DRAFT_399739 [Cucurbitaria berberidis CBS 394.84]
MGIIISTPMYPSYSEVLQSGLSSPNAGLGSLITLPREIRDLVYEQILVTDDFVNRQIDAETYRIADPITRKDNLPAILRASHPLCREVALVLIRKNAFVIRSYSSNQFLIRFLRSIPDKNGFTSIRELHFTSFQHFPGGLESADLKLAKQCTSLRKIKLTFHVSKLRKPFGPDSFSYTGKDVSELVSHYKMTELLECRMLKHVVLDGIDASWTHGSLEGGASLTQVLHSLAQWIRDEFLERKMQVVVDVTWR